jgi:hypothetical protein
MLAELHTAKHVLNQHPLISSQTEDLKCAFTIGGLRLRIYYTRTRNQHFQKRSDSDPVSKAENATQHRTVSGFCFISTIFCCSKS